MQGGFWVCLRESASAAGARSVVSRLEVGSSGGINTHAYMAKATSCGWLAESHEDILTYARTHFARAERVVTRN
jgi:hypothetical protein